MVKLNEVDLVFAIDTTGSMGGLLQQAKVYMTDVVRNLSKDFDLDLQVRLVEYRDHCDPRVTTSTRFMTSFASLQQEINMLRATGGGDIPEAVLDGIKEASESNWRDNAERIIIHIGDAPPHGATGEKMICKCKLELSEVLRLAEQNAVTVYSYNISRDRITTNSFRKIAQGTGGEVYTSGDNSIMKAIHELLSDLFSNLELQQRILDYFDVHEFESVSDIAKELGTNRIEVMDSIFRMNRRGLLSGKLNEPQPMELTS